MTENYRNFLKSSIRKTIDFSQTAQSRGIKSPPAEKPCNPKDKKINLIKPGEWESIHGTNTETAIAGRKSRRLYTEDAMNLEELSFLLWATQGLRKQREGLKKYRTVPSAGCRHALETYVAAFRVEGMPMAIYRYLPMSHQLVEFIKHKHLKDLINRTVMGHTFASKSAVTFIWTTIPERMEWRHDKASYKLIALDAGHVCQNLYLACEAISIGACAIAVYDQDLADEILGLDGDEEFTIYMAAVGKVK